MKNNAKSSYLKPSIPSGQLSTILLSILLLLFLLESRLFADDFSSDPIVPDGRDLLVDVQDPLMDDKGPGYYQYPLDQRIRRGAYDLRRFYAYEDGNLVVFVIQMRDYIMTNWPDGKGLGEELGFVGLLSDIYIDMDGKPGSGHTHALPGRFLDFSENMGWEKMILVSPLSAFRVWDGLKGKTDDPQLTEMIPDIIIPDYIEVQRDKLIIRINKELLGAKPNPQWGFQCFIMGFSPVVSTTQLWNRDVKAFPTQMDFGGGWDTYGDPSVMDLIMPEGYDQYEVLKDFRSEPFLNKIRVAQVPFVYGKKATDKTLKRGPDFSPSPNSSAASANPLAPSVNLSAAPASSFAMPVTRSTTTATAVRGPSINIQTVSQSPAGKAPSPQLGFQPIRLPAISKSVSPDIFMEPTNPLPLPAITFNPPSQKPVVKRKVLPAKPITLKKNPLVDTSNGFQPLIKGANKTIINDGFLPIPKTTVSELTN
ncbi:MAG: hypothetical protein HQM08_16405 [Candidatus Riflebacteria bacterium]|nr:hypothetical protein [Candidatus Riflebacteria bacterium]